MARRRVVSLAGRRRLSRFGAVLAAVAGLVVAVGAARAALLTLGVALLWGLLRWSRLEARLSRPPSRRAVVVRPEVWASPVRPPAGGAGLGSEAHRAYAQALHAVTGAYLAECEREVQQ